MTTLYGVPISPFVRKALTVLEIKGIPFELNIVTPMNLPEGFEQLSPLKKIPAFKDDQVTCADSTIICDYLENRYPTPALRPADLPGRVRAQWLEEYADSKLVEAILPIFFERIVKKHYLKQECDTARVDNCINNLIPDVLNYLEGQVPDSGFFFGADLSIADIAVVTQFINAMYAKFTVDADKWPKLASYLQRAMETPAIQKRMMDDAEMMKGGK